MAELTLPGSSSGQTYIKSTEVVFKAKSGTYNYYDADAGKAFDVDKIEGIIIGQGFQFNTTKTATKAKSITIVSDEFGFDRMKEGEIYMKELVRDKTGFKANNLGRKTYQDWKADGSHKMVKLIYVLDKNDLNKMYRIVFSGMAFVEINKLLKKDAPNYISQFGISSELKETENGDFYMPTLVSGAKLPDSAIDKVSEQIRFVDAILNKKSVPTLSVDTGAEIADDDIPF